MNIKELKSKINENKRLKKFIHFLIIDPQRISPRLWVRLFINPFFTEKGKHVIVKRSVKLNVTPINLFTIGNYSTIEDYSIIDNGVGAVQIGHHSRIGLRNTIIGPVYIGNNTILAQNVVLSGLNHNYADIHKPIREQGVSCKTIIIEDDSWIGANSVIAAGVHIGKHTIVAAGSVVVNDISEFSICAGVPAKVIKKYDFASNSWKKTTNN